VSSISGRSGNPTEALPESADGDEAQSIAAVGRDHASDEILVERIEEAARTVDRTFAATPQFVSDALSRIVGGTVILKLEMVNPIRSFKGRGATFFYQSGGDQAARTVVCASAGNFGQAMAYVARARGASLVVFAPANANPSKVESMRRLGARVELTGADYDEAKAAAMQRVDADGVYVEDGVDPAFTEGAGTIAVELSSSRVPIDDVVVPVGGGALATGIGRYLAATAPSVRVTGVCAAGAPAMALSWRVGTAQAAGPVSTIADGIAIRDPVPVAVTRARAWIDDMLLVEDEAMLDAMVLLLREHGLLAEPAGAAGLAAVMAHRSLFEGRVVAIPICGGNVDPALAGTLLAGWSRTISAGVADGESE